MSKKDDLRKQRANTVINNISKKQEKQLAKAIARVVDALKQKFPGIEMEYEGQ